MLVSPSSSRPRARIAVHLAFSLALGACAEAPPPPSKLVAAPPVAKVSSPPLVVAPAPAPPKGDFSLVVVARDGKPLRVHRAGDRALVSSGTGFWGYATKGAKPVKDASLSAGLPTTGENHVTDVGGRWPEIALVHGGKQFIHYAGAEPSLFAYRDGHFVLEGLKLEEVPNGVARYKKDTFAFVPSPSHYQDGARQVLERPACKAKTKRDALLALARSGQKKAPPKVPATFFQQAISEDGEGRPWIVGADVCVPGAFVAALGESTVTPELVPGSDGCHVIDEAEGVVMTHGHVYPAANGLYVLLRNEAPSLGEAVPSTGPCTLGPRLLQKTKDGAWSAPRTLPHERVSHPYVDSDGTYWGITERGTVLRAPPTGDAKELVIGPACTAPAGESGTDGKPLVASGADAVAALVVPFPDQPMIVVAYDEKTHGLCTVAP